MNGQIEMGGGDSYEHGKSKCHKMQKGAGNEMCPILTIIWHSYF